MTPEELRAVQARFFLAMLAAQRTIMGGMIWYWFCGYPMPDGSRLVPAWIPTSKRIVP